MQELQGQVQQKRHLRVYLVRGDQTFGSLLELFPCLKSFFSFLPWKTPCLQDSASKKAFLNPPQAGIKLFLGHCTWLVPFTTHCFSRSGLFMQCLDCLEQWFSAMAAHQVHLGNFSPTCPCGNKHLYSLQAPQVMLMCSQVESLALDLPLPQMEFFLQFILVTHRPSSPQSKGEISFC